jgi:hypothetical protein
MAVARRRFRPVALSGLSLAVAGALCAAPSAVAAADGASVHTAGPPVRAVQTSGGLVGDAVVVPRLVLPSGDVAVVYHDGLASVTDPRTNSSEFVHVDTVPDPVTGAATLPPTAQLIAALSQGAPTAYAANEVLVTYRSTVTAQGDLSVASPSADAGPRPAYTSDAALNATLARIGVDQTTALLAGTPAGTIGAAQRSAGAPLDLSSTYLLHLTGSSVSDAVAALRANPSVAFAEPAWRVTPTNTMPVPIPAAQQRDAARQASTMAAAAARHASAAYAVPTNYDLTSSAQSLLNAPADDVVPAYTQLAAGYGQLPGQGEIITNVSLGQLVSQDAVTNAKNPCHSWATAYGASTVISGHQRYLDWPGMPLIPTYTATVKGHLNPTGQVCGTDDPSLAEVGLDFSMMAPLPHDLQRPGSVGSGLTDQLGIAPGARYRLVEPNVSGPTNADVIGAFVAAATQRPRPNVITASLAFGFDSQGFSSRSLEDDPLMASLFRTLTHGMGIVVCFSSGDGLRMATNAAVPPSGGSAPTNTVTRGQRPTDLNDIGYSSMASQVPDSGAISVGADTLNDVTAAPPFNPRYANLVSQQAFPATRFTGARDFASDYGSRLDVSAPGDNVVSIEHALGSGPAAVQVVNEGGTSASAPQVAAAAAVVLQVARLTRDRSLLANAPAAVRALLEQTARPVPNAPQSDTDNRVGPALDLGAAVSALLRRAGYQAPPSAPRVAVVQRRATGLDSLLSTSTDPTDILLADNTSHSWITIAPDWQGLPTSGVSYQLTVNGQALASTPSTRLQPATILTAAGDTLVGTTNRTVTLVYTASADGRQLASASQQLTFGPCDGQRNLAPAPFVPPVVRGSSFQVSYDLTGVNGVTDPILQISEPGRVDGITATFAKPSYTVPLTATSGTVTIPVSALQGGGMYGIGVQQAPGGNGSGFYSEFAYTRIAPTGDARPPAPVLSARDTRASHDLEVGYAQPFAVSWDVRDVPGANGAVLEVSAPGPTIYNNANPFNNPNGSERDADGKDSGSVYYQALPGARGTISATPAALGLCPTMSHVLRVLATRDGQEIGEAGDVSTITRDGVRPADGGSITQGFAVTPNGGDGMLTSNQTNAKGKPITSVETFNQRTNAITHTLLHGGGSYQTAGPGLGAGPGVFNGDVGLVQYYPVKGNPYYDVLNLAKARHAVTGHWTLPAKDVPAGDNVYQDTAPDADPAGTAVISGNIGGTDQLVFSSNVAKNTFTTAYDLKPRLTGLGFPFVTGFAADTTNDTAVLSISDFTNLSAAPKVVTANLRTGALGSFPGTGAGAMDGIAVDSTRQLLFGASDSSSTLAVYNLANASVTGSLTPGGYGYNHPAVDARHGLFLVDELEGPDAAGFQPNDNALSSVLVLNDSGALLARITAFDFNNLWTANLGAYIQLNPATRTGYTLGAGGGEIAPFQY